MNKKVIFTLLAIVLLIGAAFAYILLKPSNEIPSPEVVDTSNETPPPSTPEPVTDEKPGSYTDYSETAVANTPGTKLLFFHASWCPQCRQIEASIKEGGVPKGVTVFKVDYDSNQTLRQKYGVTIQTTFVKIDDQGNKIESYVAYEEPQFSSVERELLR